MAVKRTKAKMNIPMCAACVLFCLTLFSFYFTGGLFARYTTNNAGSDSARVIKFGDISITEEGDFVSNDGKNTFMIIPGVDLKKDVELSFTGSEAATYVFVTIAPKNQTAEDNYTFTYKIGESVMLQWSIDASWKFHAETDGTYVYYRTLEPNESITDADVIAGDGKITVSKSITKSEIKNMTDISIKLRAAAVQAGGFKNVTEAWNSISAKEG